MSEYSTKKKSEKKCTKNNRGVQNGKLDETNKKNKYVKKNKDTEKRLS
jgi:hypothetical protein